MGEIEEKEEGRKTMMNFANGVSLAFFLGQWQLHEFGDGVSFGCGGGTVGCGGTVCFCRHWGSSN
jgi:hypothetical protein